VGFGLKSTNHHPHPKRAAKEILKAREVGAVGGRSGEVDTEQRSEKLQDLTLD
jgi:hypothetical protein